ncbi:hypothetical protein D3C78_783700 [compost metagenome]
MSGDLQIDALTACLSHGAAGVCTRVEGEDVFFLDMESGEGAAQTVIEQLALDPDFVADAFFRVEGFTGRVQAIVRLERGRGVGEQADFRCQLIKQAGPLGQRVVALSAGSATGVIVDVLLEMFEAHTEHAPQLVGEDDLVLQVQCMAFDVFEEVRTRACAVGFWLAIDRLVDVDGVGAAGNGRHPFVLAVVLVFAADQQFVLQTAGVEKAAQFELGNAVVPIVVTLAIATIDGMAVGIQRARL